jgi:hypothetical protein
MERGDAVRGPAAAPLTPTEKYAQTLPADERVFFLD